MTNQFITVPEMAKILGIGKNQAYALAKRDDFFPAKRIGIKLIRIDRTLLDEWFKTSQGQG